MTVVRHEKTQRLLWATPYESVALSSWAARQAAAMGCGPELLFDPMAQRQMFFCRAGPGSAGRIPPLVDGTFINPDNECVVVAEAVSSPPSTIATMPS